MPRACIGRLPPLRFRVSHSQKFANAYLPSTLKPLEFCLPTKSTNVPDGPHWFHEVKYVGYHLRLERDGDRVRLIARSGYNWTDRYPWIVEAARKVRTCKHDAEVQFCAFDILTKGSDDQRIGTPGGQSVGQAGLRVVPSDSHF
jgi:hypothetical protein